MLIEYGNGGVAGPRTGGSAPTARSSSEIGNGTPANKFSNDNDTGQMDSRVMNKCPTFAGRDTGWSEWSFICESVTAMANLEPAMEGTFTGLAEKPFAEISPDGA